jgi:hypothetical protein
MPFLNKLIEGCLYSTCRILSVPPANHHVAHYLLLSLLMCSDC